MFSTVSALFLYTVICLSLRLSLRFASMYHLAWTCSLSVSFLSSIGRFLHESIAPWTTPFLSTFTLPWTFRETPATPMPGLTNNGDVCERCFPKFNAMKNVFPPVSHSLPFHTHGSLGGGREFSWALGVCALHANAASIANTAAPCRDWGSTCAGSNEQKVKTDRLLMDTGSEGTSSAAGRGS